MRRDAEYVLLVNTSRRYQLISETFFWALSVCERGPTYSSKLSYLRPVLPVASKVHTSRINFIAGVMNIVDEAFDFNVISGLPVYLFIIYKFLQGSFSNYTYVLRSMLP